MAYCSPNVERELGVSADEFVAGKAAFADFVHPEDLHRIAAEGGVLLLVERPAAVVGSADDRDYGIWAQVLADLGVRRLRLMTDHPRKRAGLHGFDLEVVEHVPLRGNPIGGSSNVVALSSASKGG